MFPATPIFRCVSLYMAVSMFAIISGLRPLQNVRFAGIIEHFEQSATHRRHRGGMLRVILIVALITARRCPTPRSRAPIIWRVNVNWLLRSEPGSRLRHSSRVHRLAGKGLLIQVEQGWRKVRHHSRRIYLLRDNPARRTIRGGANAPRCVELKKESPVKARSVAHSRPIKPQRPRSSMPSSPDKWIKPFRDIQKRQRGQSSPRLNSGTIGLR